VGAGVALEAGDIEGVSEAFPTVLSVGERLAAFNQTAMATAMSPAAANLMIARIEVSSLPVWGCFAGHFTEFFDKQDSDPYSPGTCEFGTFRNIALVGTLVPRLSAVAITADRSATTMLHHACPQSRPDGLDIR